MRVATWNVNNVNKRVALLVDWLQRTQPDVVALQEIKCPTADFPTAALQGGGYSSLVVGQRTWNGVAILSRNADPLPIVTALPGDSTDKEARYLEAAITGILFACLYLPNGNPQPGPKFDYKLRWFERLRRRTEELWHSGHPVCCWGTGTLCPRTQISTNPILGAMTRCCSRRRVPPLPASWRKVGRMPSARSIARCPSRSGITGASGGNATPGCASTTFSLDTR